MRGKKIALVGMMGTSKTTSGRILAKLLDCKFTDLDAVYVEQCGDIAKTFREEGEGVFRARETELLKVVAKDDKMMVLSCGGGVVLRQENIDILQKNFFVVELYADAGEIYLRTKHDKSRPLLTNTSVMGIKQMQDEREEYYKKATPNRVDTSMLLPSQIAENILKLYES